MPTPAELFERLSAAGQRLTHSRRAVIEALHAPGAPVTARELHARVRDVNLVTVYRTVAWLVDHGVARRVAALPGAERYELAGDDAHAHHLVCMRCGAVSTIRACGLDATVVERIRLTHGFTVFRHSLTFHGVCAACQPA